jgi:hypothetical protein
MSARRLDTVVRIRRLQERLASGQVAVERQRLGIAEEAERAAWLMVSVRTPTAGSAPAMSADAFRSHRGLLAAGVDEASSLRIVSRAAGQRVESALVTWQDARQRLDGIERLERRLAVEQHEESIRKESVEMDDLVITRWNRGAA